MRAQDPKKRFKRFVNEDGPIIIPSLGKCHIWTGYKKKSGYGTFNLDGRRIGAHRAAYMIFVKFVPDGVCVLHKCDNPSCVNLNHLFLGSLDDNMKDAASKGRMPRGESSYRAILTDELVKWIREIHIPRSPSRGSVAIAKTLGIGYQAVDNVVKRKTWKHI